MTTAATGSERDGEPATGIFAGNSDLDMAGVVVGVGAVERGSIGHDAWASAAALNARRTSITSS